MQMQVIREHLHTNVAIAIQILVYADVLVHVFTRVIQEVMQLITYRATSHRVTMAGECWGNQE
jgi:hypothetical protein